MFGGVISSNPALATAAAEACPPAEVLTRK
jgi:hypothetical protein